MTTRKFIKSLTICLIMTFALLMLPSSALADVAPPVNPPGSNPQPGTENTQVRMLAETVLIEIQSTAELGSARVTADFSMRNLGSADEKITARFPISSDNGFGKYPEISGLSISANGKPISYQRVNYPDIHFNNQEVPWAEFDLTFPAGQDTPVKVTYNLSGSGYLPFTAFYYILESGAGWKDTIGSADIILRLPYPASTQNVIMGMQIGWAETNPGGVIQGNEVRWHFDNFEPGPDTVVQNMEFALVAPETWQNILKARQTADQNPTDSEAWGQLAKSYKNIFLMSRGYRSDPGGDELYKLSIQAYQKCLELNPKDAQWHAGFADLLASRNEYTGAINPNADIYQALDEIRAALALAPTDPKVLEIAQKISFIFPDGIRQNGSSYDFPWLTQTPTPVPPTPTIVPVLDPASLSGVYQSQTLTFTNAKKAQLILTLGRDHSAVLETRYESDPAETANGTWVDNGDGSLTILVTGPDQKPIEIKYKAKSDQLVGDTYPSFYGEAGLNLQRIVTASALPSATQPATQPAPQPTPLQPVQPLQPVATSPAPAPRPSLPLCPGTAALIGLVLLLYLTTRK